MRRLFPGPIKVLNQEMNRRLLLSVLCLLGFEAHADEALPSFKWSGRLQLTATTISDEQDKYNDGTETRRARLAFSGNFTSDWSYKGEYDFVGDGEYKDVFFGYKAAPNLNFKFGNFKTPQGLEQYSSSKYLLLSERSVLDSLSEGRGIGVEVGYWQDSWSVAASIVGNEDAINDGGSLFSSVAQNVRFLWNPVKQSDNIWHLGMSLAHRDMSDLGDYSVSASPGTSNVRHKALSSQTFEDTDDLWTLGAEMAHIQGPFMVNAEAKHQRIETLDENYDVRAQYVQVAYVLTQEQRGYKGKAQGVIGGITPKSEYGAWEISMRYDNLNTINQGIGERIRTSGVSLAWYPRKQIKLTLNHWWVKVEQGDGSEKESPRVLELRLLGFF